jgi:SAM-dependent methyltransferase
MTRCAVCQGTLRTALLGIEGYKRPSRFDIYECTACGSSVADALPDAALYDAIYREAERIPGYERYVRYAKAVRSSGDPLRLLARSEEMYFAIARVLAGLRLSPQDEVLEVGCGLGYLTFALRRAGIRATGWDISAPAIRDATERFGPYYEIANLYEIAAQPRFSAIVMSELIEHVPDPFDFVARAAAQLKPGGTIVVTTPNKGYFDGTGAVWSTELPPVHLWWLTESAVETIGMRLNARVAIFDFTGWLGARPAPNLEADGRARPAILDDDGRPLAVVAQPEPARLFPLSRSVVPRISRPLRACAATLGWLPATERDALRRTQTLAAALAFR